MPPEVFKLAMPGHTVVMVIAPNVLRLDAIGQIVRSLGGVPLESQLFAVRGDAVTPQTLRNAVGELEKDERVYIVTAVGETLEYHVLVRPKTEGGITVG